MKHRNAGATCAKLGMLLALALLCSYIESLIPFSFGIPGIKLGLANIVVLVVLHFFGVKEALLISVTRIILSGFLFGNLFAIVYSLAGGILSLLVMFLLKEVCGYHILTVSVAGGICHNLGQLLVAAFVVENMNVLYYISILFFAGLVTGALIGIVSREMILRLGHFAGKD